MVAAAAAVVFRGMDVPEAFATDPDAEPATRPGTIRVECRALRLVYAHLRVRDPPAEARLCASMAEAGQTSPVIVVHDVEGCPVLIDGYRRVRALVRLGRDMATAVAMGLSEADALVYSHRQETSRRRSIVEEGWLLRELQGQGLTLSALGQSLGRTPSWVSRRMALVSALPASVEEAVRRGDVPPHGAMKSLVPLARANAAHCEHLVQALGEGRLTTRQLAHLYAAWRAGDGEQRERIVGAPRLFLRAIAASAPEIGDEVGWLVQKLGAASEALARAGESLERAASVNAEVVTSPRVRRALRPVRAAWESLHTRLEEGDAGPRHADCDLEAAG
jgi:ParB family transcriptional regulator, chromosome partitioning protein